MTKKKSAAKLPNIRNVDKFSTNKEQIVKTRKTPATLGDLMDSHGELRKELRNLLNVVEALADTIRYEPTTNDCCVGTTEDVNKYFEQSSTSKTGEPMKTFESGAVRGTGCMNARYDLINPVALRRLAETYAEGAKKYGDSNWQKGIPSPDLLNHAITHIEAWRNGDTSEDHLAHAAWNLCTLMYTEERLPKLIVRHYAPGFDPNTDPTNVKLK